MRGFPFRCGSVYDLSAAPHTGVRHRHMTSRRPPHGRPTPPYNLPPPHAGAVYYPIPMTKHDFIFSHGVYFFLGLLVLTYAVFPSAYTRASQMLFTALYAYHAPSVTPAPHGDAARAAADEPAVRLHTVARPPQTPYDSMLMTAPEGDGRGTDTVGRYVYGNGVPVGYADAYGAVRCMS